MKPANVKTGKWIKYNVLFFLEHILGENNYRKFFAKTEERLYNEIAEYAEKNKVDVDFKIIEHYDGNYPEPVAHDYYPIVYRGIAKNWECTKNWDLDFFAEKFGDVDITLINNAGLVKDTNQAYDVVKFREYISRLKEGSQEYLKFSRIVEEESSLKNDFDYKWLSKFRTRFAQNDIFYFFMGGKNTVTPIHDGYATTVFVQVEGTKRWIFYPTNERLFIGARPRRYNYFYSEADPHNLNDPKFPLLKYAHPHVVELNAGDVLYFPSFVWHQVENVTDTIGVAYKFASIPSGFTSSKMLATCFFLATKPWLIETFLPWRPDTYNYKKKSQNM